MSMGPGGQMKNHNETWLERRDGEVDLDKRKKGMFLTTFVILFSI